MQESLVYFFAILTIGAIMHLLRQSLINPGAKKASKESALSARRLSPIEVAYLAKEGDSGFALLVLIFDIMHREVKDKIVGGEIEKYDSNQKGYELAIKQAVGGSLKQWSLKKIEAISNIDTKDPLRFAMRLPGLYKVIRTGVEDTVRQLFRDPRNIKKFITLPGLLRLAAEIGTSEYKTRLDNELKENLTDAGFLASKSTRTITVKYLIGSFGLCQVLLLTLILLTIPSPGQASVIYIAAIFAAFVVRACAQLRGFIPLYSELAQALAQVKEDNIRVAAVRAVLKVVTMILNTLSVVAFIALFGTGSFLLYLTHTVTSLATYFMLVAQMAVQIITLQYLMDAYKLSTGEMATAKAHHSLNTLREEFPQEEVLPAIKALLGDSDYSPELSFLIALYGLEALLLI